MYYKWEKCPTACHGMYIGHCREPTITLETVASQDLWIQHAFFGMSGSLNDVNVLDHLSSLHLLKVVLLLLIIQLMGMNIQWSAIQHMRFILIGQLLLRQSQDQQEQRENILQVSKSLQERMWSGHLGCSNLILQLYVDLFDTGMKKRLQIL